MKKVEWIVGRAGAGKTSYCYKQIEAALTEDGYAPLILLVPEQFNLQNQKDLAKYLAPGLLRAEVLSFNILAREVFREVGKKETVVVEDLERMIILRRLVEAHKKEIVFYRKNLHNVGFLEAMNRFITVLEQAGVGSSELQAMEQHAQVGMLFQSKLNDIQLVYQAFQDYLGTQFATSERNMILLAQSIEQSQQLAESQVWIDGFYGFTHTQMLIIQELMKKVKKLTITLPMDRLYTYTEGIRPTHPFYESILTMQKLMGYCQEAGINYEVKEVSLPQEVMKEKEASLQFLEKYYFSTYPKVYGQETCGVRLRTYVSRKEEVEQTAREIVRLIRDHGYRYHDIAIIVGDLSAYQTQVERIFKAYELPYFLDMNRNIHTNSLVATLEGVLEVMVRSYSYKSMMSLLRTYLFPIDKEEIDVIENYILAHGIKGKKRWQSQWTYGRDEEEISQINKLREKVIGPIMKLEQCLLEVKSGGKYQVVALTRALYDFLEDIEAYAYLQQRVNRHKASGNRLLELENAQMWDKVMEVFERLVDILGDEQLTLSTYKKILETSFSYIKMGVIPPSSDQILIGSIDRTRLPRVKACFILGTNEGLIPNIETQGDLFSDMDKVTLGAICDADKGPVGRLGDLVINQPRYGANFNIYTMLTRATHQLFVSAALVDESGKALRPSMVYFKLKKMFGEIPRLAENAMACLERPVPAFSYVANALREYVEGRENGAVWKDTMSWFVSHEAWQPKLKTLIEYLFYSNQQHYLLPETTQRLYGDALHTSISRLENFRQCACCYFLKYGLKAEERQLFSLDRAQVGTLFHAALEQYPKELSIIGTKWVEATSEEMRLGVQRATSYALEKMGHPQMETGRFKFIASKVEKMTGRAVKALTVHLKNGEFNPEGYEVSFGEGQEFPPIHIEIDENRCIEIKGTIDRIDVFYKAEEETYIKILDYKSGAKNFDLVEVYYGLQLQLLLYLEAYLEKHPQYQPGGIFYFHINNPYVSYKVGMEEAQIEESSLKQYKLSGLVLDDVEVIKALDKSGTGTTVPASFNKDGSLKKGSSVATKEQFEQLKAHIVETIATLGKDILEGKVSVRPYELNGKNPCGYCNYHTICQFTQEQPDNCYDQLNKCTKDEIWRAIQKEER